ncbi:MAG: site-specific integrase [Fimbriimonas sp.]
MANKRGQNEGTISQRQDGRWEARVTIGYEGGKLRRKSLYGKTRKEVQEKMTVILRQVQQGLPVANDRMTVAGLLEDWLQTVVAPSKRPKTFHSYSQIVRLHLIPDLGRIVLSKLTAQDVQRLINQKSKSDLSPRTVQYIRDVLRNALNQAIKWDLVPRNVAELSEVPQVKRHVFIPLDPEEASLLLSTVKGHPLEALFCVALAVGLRIGEATGLRWNDIDLNGGLMSVNNQLQKVGTDWRLVPPKTSRGVRRIDLPTFAVTALRSHRERQQTEDKVIAGPEWQEMGFVFTTSRGTPLDPANIRRTFSLLLKKAGLAQMRFHDLRHTCASLLLAQGVQPRVVMEILGHSQISLTMDTYSHVIPSLRKDAATLMDSLLASSK